MFAMRLLETTRGQLAREVAHSAQVFHVAEIGYPAEAAESAELRETGAIESEPPA
jgi:hypothetical protein